MQDNNSVRWTGHVVWRGSVAVGTLIVEEGCLRGGSGVFWWSSALSSKPRHQILRCMRCLDQENLLTSRQEMYRYLSRMIFARCTVPT